MLVALHYRRDSVEVILADEPACAARVIWYFTDILGVQLVLVRWMRVEREKNPVLGVFECKDSPPTLVNSYSIVPIEAITGHAHLVPNFDKNGSYFWDTIE